MKIEHPELLITEMSQQLQQLIEKRCLSEPIILGIRSGGVWVAERLHQLLKIKEPMGLLDINFYRDDFSRVSSFPQVKPSAINNTVDDRHIILVDDVIHSGRTVCAALNEIADYGRAATVSLVIMIDRGGREMPIYADIVGTTVELKKGQHIKLRGPDPLYIEIIN
ncbi:MAG: bifunctional pyr operon transcriptional regulator/uracil phosphoribosyltransferase PyrR [Chromatiales bacterium]|nr:bifunctional pyr operon transcriptional regulator/uracil phosphoribosyltransferase PyrR [Chromatiales bacterium]